MYVTNLSINIDYFAVNQLRRVLPYSGLYQNASSILSLRMKFTAAHWETSLSQSLLPRQLLRVFLFLVKEWDTSLRMDISFTKGKRVPCFQSSGWFSMALNLKRSHMSKQHFWSGLIWNPSVLCTWHGVELGWDFSGIWINQYISRICFLDLFESCQTPDQEVCVLCELLVRCLFLELNQRIF